jgi:hypothetical protein
MRRAVAALALAAFVSGCASHGSYSDKSVTRMKPGFGVMVATFTYVPGESTFPESQVLKDAKYTVGRLEANGYEPFIVYSGSHAAQVGIRASSHRLALALKTELDAKKSLSLGDGNSIPIVDAPIKNISELQLHALDRIP